MKILADRRLILIAGIVFMAFLLTNTLLTSSISERDLIYTEGGFLHLEKKQIKGKVSYSYDIAIGQQQKLFKVSADFIDCFDFIRFSNEVIVGDKIRIGFTEKDGPFRKGSIASIVKNDIDYYDLDCRNSETEESKVLIPIITLIAISVFIGLLIWMTKNKNTKHNRT